MSNITNPRCSACPRSHRQVFGNGPTNARIFVIGEGPGFWEDRDGVPFVGKSGQELDNTYLPLAGLSRDEVFITNIVQCRCERNGVDVKPGDSLSRTCASNHLWPELEAVQPSVIVLCGATACSMFGVEDLEMRHGFPEKNVTHGAWVVPMYHPAAGLHETRFMTPLLEDWERLGRWLRGKWEPPKGEESATDYRIVRTELEFARYLELGQQVSCDSETDQGKPYSLQYSVRAGTGRFVEHSRKDLVRLASRHAEQGRGFIFHNAAFDIDIVERCGGWVGEFRDTMQELYHIGNYPQGLKAAVYRVFGHRMTSYDEVVTPHSKRVLEGWLASALGHATDLRNETIHPVGKDCPVCGRAHRKELLDSKPHAAEAVLRRIMDRVGDPASEYDPWEQPKYSKGQEKCRLVGRDWLAELESRAGRMPRPSIVHAPMAEQIQYAVGDADWTGRLATWLEGESKRIVREEWAVA